MISELANTIILLVLLLTGFIYYLIKLTGDQIRKEFLFSDREQLNLRALFTMRDQYLMNDKSKFILATKQNGDDILEEMSNQIHDGAMYFFWLQAVHMTFTVFIICIIIIFLYKFEPECFWITGSLIFGAFTLSFVAYFAVRDSSVLSARIILESSVEDPLQVSLQKGWITATTVVIGSISMFLLLFFPFFLLVKRLYLPVEHDKEILIKWMHIMVAFGLGSVIASLFFREAGSQAGKGITIGSDLIGPYDHNRDLNGVFYTNLHSMNVIGDIYTHNITVLLDFLSVFSIILTVTMVIAGHSEILNKGNFSGMYFPMMLIAFNILVALCLIYMVGNGDQTNAITLTDPAFNLQFWLFLVINAVLYILLIFMHLPETLSIGDAQLWAVKDLSRWRVYFCMLIGLVVQMALVLYARKFTNTIDSGATPTKNLLTHINKWISFSQIDLHIYTNLSLWGVILVLAILIMCCFLLAGLFGIAIAALTIVGSPILFVSMSIAANSFNGAYRLSQLTSVRKEQRENFRDLAHVGNSYAVLAHFLNANGMFLINVMAITCVYVITYTHHIYVWNCYGIFGFLYGAGLAYYLKGSAIGSIRDCSERTIQDDESSKMQKKEGNLQFIEPFLFDKFQIVVWKVLLNIGICTISIILLGVLLSKDALITFLIGLNFVGLHLVLVSVIAGNSARNAGFYHAKTENEDDTNSDTRDLTSSKQLGILALCVEAAPASHLFMYILFCSMLILVCSLPFDKFGFLKLGLEKLHEESIKPEEMEDPAEGSFWKIIGEAIDQMFTGIVNLFSSQKD